MTYPFVHAKYDYGVRTGPVKAFLIHMAEGGGTVAYLANNPLRGVSVHYVIEYSGRIVRMLDESHASGSVNPQDIRTTDDSDGFYGVTAAKAVMGSWWSNPNAAVISLEIEGFAKAGPNADQQNALVLLVTDVWSRYPGMGLLGHRDFADYKACPGTHIDWARLGGHGPAKEIPKEPPVDQFNAPTDQLLGLPANAVLYTDTSLTPDAGNVILSSTRDLPLIGVFPSGTRIVAYKPGTATVPHSYFVKATVGTVKDAPPPPAPDCTAAVHAGVKAAVNGTLDVVSVALSNVVTTVEKARVA